MISLQNDYSEGAHPQILKRLAEINLEQNPGYCSDTYCAGAAEKIRKACACPEAEVFFLVGGTQTNQVVIDTMLAPYEGVVAAHTGHVSTHEAGAIEFTGHKVLELPQHTSTWFSPAWSISPTRPNMARCTVKRSWNPYRRPAMNIKCLYIWTAPVWPTV